MSPGVSPQPVIITVRHGHLAVWTRDGHQITARPAIAMKISPRSGVTARVATGRASTPITESRRAFDEHRYLSAAGRIVEALPYTSDLVEGASRSTSARRTPTARLPGGPPQPQPHANTAARRRRVALSAVAAKRV